jgi:hypothetical protein
MPNSAEQVLGSTPGLSDMFGRFLEEAVDKALAERTRSIAETVDNLVAAAITSHADRLVQASKAAAEDFQGRAQQISAATSRTIQREAEQVIDKLLERLAKHRSEAVGELSGNLQEHFVRMLQESEQILKQQVVECSAQAAREQALQFSQELDKIRQTALEEITRQHVEDFQAQLHTHIQQSCRTLAEQLVAPS